MRICMTFVVRDEDVAGLEVATAWRTVLYGPAWGAPRAALLFELMDVQESLAEGRVSLHRLTVGLARARAELPLQTEDDHVQVARMLESLSTWATVARLRGATDLAWISDF